MGLGSTTEVSGAWFPLVIVHANPLAGACGFISRPTLQAFLELLISNLGNTDTSDKPTSETRVIEIGNDLVEDCRQEGM